jgi:hypothetical protein
MQVKVSLHVFGSIRGYATLAKTDDITVEECAKLESFSFGQTSDSNYLDSLDKNPAIISRPLDPGRWAITRVLKGNPDDYNRQTMLFVTAIISTQDWLNVLCCDVMPLLDCPQLWQFSPAEKLTPVDVNISSERPVHSPEMCEKVIPLLSAIETLDLDEEVTVLLDSQQYDIQVLRWLNMILPQNSRRNFSCAVRSLSDGIDVDVISLSPIASIGNSTRKVLRLKEFPTIGNSMFSSMVNKSWHKEGVPPWGFIDKCPSFNIYQDIPIADEKPLKSYHAQPISQKSLISRRSITLATKAFLVLLVMAIIGIACYLVIAQIIVKKQVKQKIGDLIKNSSTFLETHKDLPLLAVNGQLDESIKKSSDLIKDIETVTAEKADSQLIAEAERDKLKDWLDKAYNSKNKYDAINQLIRECETANMSKLPDIYPADINQIKRVLEIEKRCKNENILNDAISFRNDFAKKITENINMLKSWLGCLKKLLNEKSQAYETAISKLPKNEPTFFEYETLKNYEDVQKEFSQIKENITIRNAQRSPIEDDKKLAIKLLDDISDVNDKKIEPNIKRMETWRDESTKLCQEANSLNDVNELYQKLNEAKKKWPANPNIGVLSERLDNLFLSMYEDAIRTLPKNDPNFFDEGTLSKYEEVQKELLQIKEHPTLKNAIESPIVDHSDKARILLGKINDVNDSIVLNIKKMETWRDESTTLCQEANSLIEKLSPTVKDINDVKEISKKINVVNEIYQKLNGAKKKWPANPGIGVLSERPDNLFLSIEENVLKVTDKNRIREISDCLKSITFDGDIKLENNRKELLDKLSKQAK